jgi:hypothetical protein
MVPRRCTPTSLTQILGQAGLLELYGSGDTSRVALYGLREAAFDVVVASYSAPFSSLYSS